MKLHWDSLPTIRVVDAGYLLAGLEPERKWQYAPPLVTNFFNLIRDKTGAVKLATLPGERMEITQAEYQSLKAEYGITPATEPAPAQNTATPASVMDASDGPETLPAVPNWKMRIQAEAAELFLRLLASGANPTPHSLVKPMAKWCRDNEIKTDGNINPSEGYIRTHVLGGDHWTPPTMSREQAKNHVAQVAQTKVAQVAQ